MKRSVKTFTLALVAPLTLCSAAWAQAPRAFLSEGAVRQVQSTRQRQALSPTLETSFANGETAPELYGGESEDVGAQLLIIQKPRRTYFEAGVDLQYFYTSNVLLTERAPIDTGLFVTTAQVAFAPEPFAFGTGEVAVRAGYRHQRFMYGLDSTSNQLNNFDFDNSSLFANARYSFAPNWEAFVGLEYNRLLSHENNWDEFYTEILPAWGLERRIPLGPKNSLILALANGVHFTHTDPLPETNTNDRIDSILSLTWNYELLPSVVFQPYYRFQYTHYWDNGDRNDFFNTLGASLVWAVTDWASVRTFINWESRTSDDELIQDYTKVDAGAGLSVSVRF